MNEPSIAILSDQNLFREGVVQLLRSQGFQQISEYQSAAELQREVQNPPQLVLVDMDHRTDDPLALVRELRCKTPHATVVIMGAVQQRAAFPGTGPTPVERPEAAPQALRAAVSLAQAAQESNIPEQPSAETQNQQRLWGMMTPRQRDVLGYLSTGSDNLKIAANLGISERAVKAHVSALLSLFSAENRTELAVLACRAGLRPPLRSMPRNQNMPQARAG